jgi:hypothetical protein
MATFDTRDDATSFIQATTPSETALAIFEYWRSILVLALIESWARSPKDEAPDFVARSRPSYMNRHKKGY